MKYANAADFRRALEARLRVVSQQQGVPLVRLRKLVAFDRLLARLVYTRSDAWVMKGGLALQLRLGQRARTTNDMDLLLQPSPADPHGMLVQASGFDLADWFQFLIEQSGRNELPEGGKRFLVRTLLDSRPFETFHLDVGLGDVLIEPAQYLAMPALLEFAQIAPTIVPCYPIAQQVAEKVHAYTRPHTTGEGTRVKDLVDILLLASLEPIVGANLRQALVVTFETRKSHQLPQSWPAPPHTWDLPFRRLASDVQLRWLELSAAHAAARLFIDPVLESDLNGSWGPVTWSWQREGAA